MTVKPGFKQTEIGAIPEDWQTTKVGDVCGCIVPGRNKPKFFDGDIPWITTPDLENGKPVTTSRAGLCVSRAEAKSVGSKVVPPGAVLMSCAGELGIVALTHNEIVVNQQLHVFIPTERILGTYLLSALAFQKDQIESSGTKTAVPYLNKNGCNSIAIPLPPLPEQRAIAAALSDADEWIASLDRLIAKKRDIKQAAMQQLLTGKTRLPGFSVEWDEVRLGQLFSFKNGLNKAKQFFGYGTPIVNYMDVFKSPVVRFSSLEGRVSLTAAELNNFDVRKGDVFFTRTSETAEEVGIASVMLDEALNTVFSGFVLRARPLDHRLNHAFKAYCFSSPIVRKQITSKASYTTRALTNGKILSEVLLPLPPTFEEQAVIAAALSDMDAELAALKAQREKARSMKQGMMQELLTGRIRLI
ncbi:MAG: restriction endonuclease subunit S [Rhodomicrobium sp.]